MKYKEYKIRHNELERDILNFLRTLIEESTITSKTRQVNCIKVNVFGYTELVILHDDLTFIGEDNEEYGIYSDCCLEDLIDIISQI